MQNIIQKDILVTLFLNINATEASSKEPVGPTLGQYGIDLSGFCSLFNNLSDCFLKDTLVKVKITIFTDRKFEITLFIPSIFFYLKKIFPSICFDKANVAIDSILYLPIVTNKMLFTVVNYLKDESNFNINHAFIKILSGLKSSGFYYLAI